MLTAAKDPCVLHVAELSNRDALQTLCRTMPVIATAGVRQVLLSLSEDAGGDVIRSAAAAAEVRTLGSGGLSLFGKLKALQAEFSTLDRERSLHTVHLHGMGACLLGLRALQGTAQPGRVLCSPHLPYSSAWTGALMGCVLRTPLQALRCAAVTTSPAEAQALSKLLNRSAEMLPHWVSGVFFDVDRRETARPRVLVDGSGAAAVDMVTRLSVLLNSRGTRVPISWLSGIDGRSAGRMAAAGVELLVLADDGMRARELSRASAFVHVSSLDPTAVAQAMAAGVPCLVSDTPSHRALIRHGETGFICSSELDFVEKLILLLRNRAERERLGEAARAEAGRWFTGRHFEDAVLRAYGFFRRGLKHEADSQTDSARPGHDSRARIRAIHAGGARPG